MGSPAASTTSGSAAASAPTHARWPSIGRRSKTRRCTPPITWASPHACASSEARIERSSRVTTLRLAHRGDWRVAPENTLPAIEAALRIPACDGLEFDLRCSVDGVPVLLHDADLRRVQSVPLACSTLTVSELAEHGIPTLAEVLAAVGCDPFLDIELKEP